MKKANKVHVQMKFTGPGNYSVGTIHFYTIDTAHNLNSNLQPRAFSCNKDLYF